MRLMAPRGMQICPKPLLSSVIVGPIMSFFLVLFNSKPTDTHWAGSKSSRLFHSSWLVMSSHSTSSKGKEFLSMIKMLSEGVVLTNFVDYFL